MHIATARTGFHQGKKHEGCVPKILETKDDSPKTCSKLPYQLVMFKSEYKQY